ncbi:MAG: ABC transporter substrate-binding protein, partial [Caldilineaceae bacterium]|nr:ABC transporter substrate-binding protein [Caldilineaceae bacterium]
MRHPTEQTRLFTTWLLCSLMLLTSACVLPPTPVSSTDDAAPSATAPAAAEPPASHVSTDAFGREVELPAGPQRIIAHYFASDMVALGLPMIGTNYVNAELVLTPEQLAVLTDTGTGDPNVETILSLQPDLIFVPDFTDAAVVDLLA